MTGIGATPCISVVADILHYRRGLRSATIEDQMSASPDEASQPVTRWSKVQSILLIWTCRGRELFDEFEDTLSELQHDFGGASVQLFDTSHVKKHGVVVVSDSSLAPSQIDSSLGPNVKDNDQIEGPRELHVQTGRPILGDLLSTYFVHSPRLSSPTHSSTAAPPSSDLPQQEYTALPVLSSRELSAERCGIFACGPELLLQDLHESLTHLKMVDGRIGDQSIHIHTEVFQF